MHRASTCLLALALAGSSLVAPPLDAQRLTLSPQLGFYIPTEDLYTLSTGGDAYKIEAGLSFGAALGLWFGERAGLSVGGSYVPTTFKLNETGTVNSEDAKLFTGTAQAVLFLLPRTAPLSVFLRGGMGVVSRGGVAFTDDADTSDLAGVFGAGAAIRLGGISLTLGADLYSYTATFEGTGQTSSDFSQRDIQLKLGLGFPVGGR